jgi:hypothetical protein
MLKISLKKFLALAGLKKNSVFAAEKLFKEEGERTLVSWDRLMKKSRVYDKTPNNVSKAIADTKKSKEK